MVYLHVIHRGAPRQQHVSQLLPSSQAARDNDPFSADCRLFQRRQTQQRLTAATTGRPGLPESRCDQAAGRGLADAEDGLALNRAGNLRELFQCVDDGIFADEDDNMGGSKKALVFFRARLFRVRPDDQGRQRQRNTLPLLNHPAEAACLARGPGYPDLDSRQCCVTVRHRP